MKRFLAEAMFFKNWQEKENYQDLHRHTLKMWAWEFLRRHPEYKLYWQEKVSEYLSIRTQLKEKGLETNKLSYAPTGLFSLGGSNPYYSSPPYDLPLQGGFVEFASAQNMSGGLASLFTDPTPPPGYSSEITVNVKDDTEPDHPHFCIVAVSATEKWGVSYLHAPENDTPLMFKHHDDTKVYAHDEAPKIYPSQNEVIIKINLAKRIQPQLDKYQKKLLIEQAKKPQKITDIKIRANIWPNYLRILDAEAENNFKRQAAAKIIFPKVGNPLERYNTSLHRAKELMNGEYRKWL